MGQILYKQKYDTFIRIYDDGTPSERIGYIMTKCNFNDRVTDASGAVFLAALSRQPQTLDTLVEKIAQSFIGIDLCTLKQDTIEFYQNLEDDGFIISGVTTTELDQKDSRFSYKAHVPKTIRNDFTPIIQRAKETTQEYMERYFKEKPHLVSMQIELTSRCNERCIHCYIPHQNKLYDIDNYLFYTVLDQCRDMGLLNLTLSGGEPMCHPNFLEFLHKANEYDFAVTILSNLTLLTNDIISAMKACHSTNVQVSLYSMNPEVHDSITQLDGSFYRTRDAILRLIENDIPLRISCPTMKQNKNDYREVLKWAHKHKIKAPTDYILMARCDRTTDNLDNRLSIDDVGKIITNIIDTNEDYQNEILKPNFAEQDSRDRSNDLVCGVCVSSIQMGANGNVYPCSGWQNYVCGNVKEMPLKEIWNNSPKVKYLRSLRKKDFPKCRDCEDKAFCVMCMVRNANENSDGDPLKINEHFCKVAKINREIVLAWKKSKK